MSRVPYLVPVGLRCRWWGCKARGAPWCRRHAWVISFADWEALLMRAQSRPGWLRKLCVELAGYRAAGEIPPAPRPRRRARGRPGPRRVEESPPTAPPEPPRETRFSARGRSLEELRAIVLEIRGELEVAETIAAAAGVVAPVLVELYYEPNAREAWALEVLRRARFLDGAAARSDATFLSRCLPAWRVERYDPGELPNLYRELGQAADSGIEELAELVAEISSALRDLDPVDPEDGRLERRVRRLLEVALTLERDGALAEDEPAAESG